MKYKNIYSLPIINYSELRKNYILHKATDMTSIRGYVQRCMNLIVQETLNKQEVITNLENLYITNIEVIMGNQYIYDAYAQVAEGEIPMDFQQILHVVQTCMNKYDKELEEIFPDFNSKKGVSTMSYAKSLILEMPDTLSDATFAQIEETFDKIANYFVNESKAIVLNPKHKEAFERVHNEQFYKTAVNLGYKVKSLSDVSTFEFYQRLFDKNNKKVSSGNKQNTG